MKEHFSVEYPKLDDLISYKGEEVAFKGWGNNNPCFTPTISNWRFEDFHRERPDHVYPYNHQISTNGRTVYFNQVNFNECVFKDIDFVSGVPLDCCLFTKCKFENCMFGEHIRWNEFRNSSFKYCVFTGYMHGSKFARNCKFENILVHSACYGKIPKILMDNSTGNNKLKEQICEYFKLIPSL